MRLASDRTAPGKRLMAYTAAAMYGGAAFAGLFEDWTAGGQTSSLIPGFAALALVVVLSLVGPRLPLAALAALAPIGAVLIAYALATTDTPGDGALLYIWPVLWVAYFFGSLGSVLIVAWIALVHGLALTAMPAGLGNVDRWLDVVISTSVVAAVVHALAERNKRLLQRLADEARVDQLTGVLNRRGFEERVDRHLERARREGVPVAVISFDIDHFKRINDEAGHETGDRVLARLGAILGLHTRGSDIVARVGGEEFVAVLADSDADAAEGYAERVRQAFSEADDPSLPAVTLSAGVTAAAAPRRPGELLHEADAALYAAKRAGRNRTIVSGRPATEAAALAGRS